MLWNHWKRCFWKRRQKRNKPSFPHYMCRQVSISWHRAPFVCDARQTFHSEPRNSSLNVSLIMSASRNVSVNRPTGNCSYKWIHVWIKPTKASSTCGSANSRQVVNPGSTSYLNLLSTISILVVTWWSGDFHLEPLLCLFRALPRPFSRLQSCMPQSHRNLTPLWICRVSSR